MGAACCQCSRRPTRFAGKAWSAPVVDLAGVDESPALARWVRARIRPKLLVATQSALIEAVPDPEGRLLPSVPVIAVEPGDPESLWLLLAVLLSPLATARALERYAGAALSGNAVKLSARQLLELPLPARRAPWQQAAESCRLAWVSSIEHDEAGWRRHLEAAARAASRAYGLSGGPAEELQRWWEARLPPWPSPKAARPSSVRRMRSGCG
jgi:hypothetical protein